MQPNEISAMPTTKLPTCGSEKALIVAMALLSINKALSSYVKNRGLALDVGCGCTGRLLI